MIKERALVATVLTVYGIETSISNFIHLSLHRLQQYLPFTVLKRVGAENVGSYVCELQQYLPFTVLKPPLSALPLLNLITVATVLTVYGIETG